MKKQSFFLIILGVLMALVLSGCGGTEEVEPVQEEAAASTETEKVVEEEAAPAETEEVEPSTDAKAKVYFLLPNSTTIRFTRRDAPLFVEAMAELAPNAEVIVQNGEGDPALQQQLVEDAITQGADLLVYTSSDANLAAGSLNAAEEAGVPVVLYEHDANGGLAEAHVLFDALAVGQAQGGRALELIEGLNQDVVKIGRVKGNQGEFGTIQYEIGQNEFLQPLIDAGQVEVVCEQFTPNWDPTLAQAFAEDCLTQNPDIDMFIGMNDGTTGGAVAALISQGYNKGDVIATGGQDATVEALQFIIQGWQDNTIFKDLSVMAEAAAEVSASILGGQGVPTGLINGEVNNDFMDVPAVYLPVENITADGVSKVVEAGIWSWEEVCQGGEDTDICQANLP
jgi:D-xylose transport system substrate-binding protein